ncbi:MAG: ABC transporter [Bacteroidetes bacterium GWF2_38_335]|nr:MAG: ABC transporter [Bacteroidetes bacterium GWF2_38_335]OFY79121.1 MAG: ABC transporter [Bacteroidetes bacterium RIFOXYA12_FULL_38_20]HBS88792.1 ABC transporter [Bacteroidales bacterium]
MPSYLQTESISKRIGDLILFENININIDKDRKIALIARNGAGKSSLLDILAGREEPDSGKISRMNGLKTGYLEQNPVLNEANTILNEVLHSSDEMNTVLSQYHKFVEDNDTKNLEHILSEMDRLKAWDYDSKVKQVLTRLKLDDFSKKIQNLSGGQKKRVALASVILGEPELLILDEPTNHLDLDMIEWLEDYLFESRITLLMVTHDRYFLDRVCDEIWELDEQVLYKYDGNYSKYLEKKDQRISNILSETDKARNLMRTELDWMRRMPKARSTKAKYRVNEFYNLQEKASVTIKEEKINLNVQSARLGKKVLEVKNLKKSFGDLKILNDFSYIFSRFEKIGIIGRNGTGKSTFLNMLTGKLSPDSGEVDAGQTVNFGYYTQEGIKINENEKVVEVAQSIAEIVTLSDGNKMSVTSFLNYFLFPHKTQYSYVSKLSGGEKRRLYLMTVLMRNPNFLILDEPTNDLDILTLNVLEDYLKDFSGCVIVVSHDRYFLDKIVDHIFVFEGNGVVKDFPGNYTQYRDHYEKLEAARPASTAKEKTVRQKPLTEKKKLTYKEKIEYETLQREVEELSRKKIVLEEEMNSGRFGADDLVKKSEEYGIISSNLDEKEMRWLELDEMNG